MDNTIYIQDDNGKEIEFNILFTFENETNKYVVTYLDNNDDEIYAFRYDDDGNLIEIETEDEMKMVEEVVSAFDNVDEVDQ